MLVPVMCVMALVLFLRHKHSEDDSYRMLRVELLTTSTFTATETEASTTGTFTATETEAYAAGSSGASYTHLSQSDVDRVEKFVLFIGHGRSGHSIIGAMIDAHPNAVIAHEYRVLRPCVLKEDIQIQSKAALFNGLYGNSYNNSKYGWRSDRGTKKGYNLHIQSRWVGSFSQLKVIGDKGAGMLSRMFESNFTRTTACFNLLKETIKIPIVIFHVIRNPFDMIATFLADMHQVPNVREMLLEGKKLTLKPAFIMRAAWAVFRKAEASLKAINSDAMKDLVVVEIHIGRFTKYPREHITKICEALSIPCPARYIEACYEKVYKNISKSREIIEWDDNVVNKILETMKKFPFFSGYTFSS